MDFGGENEWGNKVVGIIIYDFKYKYSMADKVMTFSTCYKDESDIRLVVHAKMI